MFTHTVTAAIAVLVLSSGGDEIFKLLADDGTRLDQFGWSVAISGTTAIVGAYSDDDFGEHSGSAYLFDVTTGRQLLKILPDDGAEQDFFGYSVAISGDTLIVGAFQDDDNGEDSGSAYIFDVATGRQLLKLLPNDGAPQDWFGRAVSISGAIAIVGAPRTDDFGANSGSAYLFDVTTGRQLVRLGVSDGGGLHQLGKTVAIDGATGRQTAVAGAPWDYENGLASGSAYVFDAAAYASCPADLDGDGSVGASDLLALLANWGPCR